MHYLRSYYARQVPGVPQPMAAGPQGPGGHNNFSDSALAGLLIIICGLVPGAILCSTPIKVSNRCEGCSPRAAALLITHLRPKGLKVVS